MTTTHPATLDPTRTLGDLVAEHPARARVFEAVGIDYCCKGRRTLADASRTAGLDLDQVVASLEALAEPVERDADALAPDALADHIEATHHAYLHDELPLLEALAAKVAGVHGGRHPELADVARLVAEVRADLEPHLTKEERVLFPVARRLVDGPVADLPFGSVANPIAVLMAEHEVTGELLARLRRAADGYELPGDACASYTSLYQRLRELESDTFRHIHLENNVLFPALAALGEAG